VNAASSGTRLLRADAQRNYGAIRAAAKTVFARAGIGVPTEDIARPPESAREPSAGASQRAITCSRRSSKDRVDELDASARRALDVPDVWEALSERLKLYDRCATEYLGMSARIAPGRPAGVLTVLSRPG
jgi:hypothetical protein